MLVLIFLSHNSVAQENPVDWQALVRQYVAAHDIPGALTIVEHRLSEAPQDLEARGWRARLLAWSQRWQEAEGEYRRVLEAAPQDVDILLGLADVLAWQKRLEEALPLLDHAQQIDPRRVEVYTRRGRVLGQLGRVEEARAAYRGALALDPKNMDAQAGLEALEPEPRHEFRLETDFDHFPFAEDAQSLTASLQSRLSARWASHLAGDLQHRFGQRAGRFLGSASYRLSQSDTLTAGGGASHDEGVIPKGQAFFEYGHGFRLSNDAAVRGVELSYRQQWLWYREARLLVLTPTVLLYLPRDWTWSLNLSLARSRFPGTAADWDPSGTTRLSFPLNGKVRGNLFFGVGTENFAQVDQVGRFSARTFGGGARWQFARRQDVAGYFFYQDRSQDRIQTGFGFTYGIRF